MIPTEAQRLSEQAVFVDGIGPPLQQIREDHLPSMEVRTPESQASRDIVALIDAYLSLARQLAEAKRENERLRPALEELLEYAQRVHRGDPNLVSEDYYITRDFARVALNPSESSTDRATTGVEGAA